MAPKDLTDRTVNALRRKPAKPGKTYDVMDGNVPGFGVRVNERGVLTYFLSARYPGTPKGNPGRRAIGRHGVMTLENARNDARRWKELIGRGVDPQEEKDRVKREQDRRRVNTFAAVAEDFIAAMDPTERKREEVARDIRRELVVPLGPRPAIDISPRDIIEVVQKIKARGAPHQARNVLGYARRLFGWAVAQHAYGIDRSPCETLRPEKIIGRKIARKRILEDDEIRAAWEAATEIGYPYGPVFQLLFLNGARKSEIANARRRELDTTRAALVIPPERQKSDEAHIIPLGDDARAVVDSLPRFEGKADADYLFSTTAGAKPVNGFSKAKAVLDREMQKRLGRKLEPFVIHDIRRTMRTHLSALPIPQHVAERIIGHAQPGLIQTYDRWSFLEEKREGLRLWEARLRSILTPSSAPEGGKVLLLKSRAAVA